MDKPNNSKSVLAMTSSIVANYVARNPMPLANLGSFITQVHRALSGIGATESGPAGRPEPAVSIKRSVTADYIICLEDGRKLKMLKRHLKTAYNLTPDQYRRRWGLPSDYPMVAPNYAIRRSQLAKQIGLGTARRRG